MARNNAIIILPLVNPADIPGTITHVLLLYPDPTRREEALRRTLEEFNASCFLARTKASGNAMVGLAAQTLAQTEENLVRARRLERIRDAKWLILKGITEYTRWLDSAIDRKIAESAKTQAGEATERVHGPALDGPRVPRPVG
jgi:hypothetical protein